LQATSFRPAGSIRLGEILNLWPAPNNANVSTNNFTTVASTGGDQNQLVWRADHNIKTRQRLFSPFQLLEHIDLPIDPLGSGLCADRCSENYHSSAMAAGYTHTFTPTVIFGFNVSASRFSYDRRPKNSGFDLTTNRLASDLQPECPRYHAHAAYAVRRKLRR